VNIFQITVGLGILAALAFLGAVLVAVTRIVPPKKRLRLHRALAGAGLLAGAAHILLVWLNYL
jgi:hypothetical protein